MKRQELYEAYTKMTNKEKVRWSENCGYESVAGLRKYLKTDKEEVGNNILEALDKTITRYRAEELGIEFNITIEDVIIKAYSFIKNCKSKDDIIKLRERLIGVCNMEIHKLEEGSINEVF